MNHFDEFDFNDSLGQMIQWSLRADATDDEPAVELWQNIERRIQAVECTRSERRARRALPRSALHSGRARNDLARLAHWLKRAAQRLDENTISSEAVWSPESSSVYAANAFRNRTISLWVVARPIFAQIMPIY